MGPALEFAHGELLASVADGEARYIVKDHATEYEMPRMKAIGAGKKNPGPRPLCFCKDRLKHLEHVLNISKPTF